MVDMDVDADGYPIEPEESQVPGVGASPEAGAIVQEEAKPNRIDDGISDLFEVDDDPDTDDLIEVDMEKDIIDGDLSDLTEVSEEDVLGDDLGQVPRDVKPGRAMRPKPVVRRLPLSPGSGMGGVRY